MFFLRDGISAFILYASCAAAMNWSSLVSVYDNPYTAQRDISLDNTIDQLTFFGISLNRVIFDTQGYANTSLATLTNFLELRCGLFMLDLYWNHFTQKWQLCPAPIPATDTVNLSSVVQVSWDNQTYMCSPEFTVNDVFKCVESYLTSTNVRLEANMVQFAFNLKSIYHQEIEAGRNVTSRVGNHTSSTIEPATEVDDVPSQYTGYSQDYLSLGNSSLSDSLGAIGSYYFTPSDLQSWQSASGNSVEYPTQDTYLFTLYKRVFPFVLNNTLHNSSSGYNVSSVDEETIFFYNKTDFTPWVENHASSALASNISRVADGEVSANFAQWQAETHFRIIVDDSADPFTNTSVSTYLKSGFSAILNTTSGFNTSDGQALALEIANRYTPASFWSWAVDAFYDTPQNETDDATEDYEDTDRWYQATDHQTAYSCVSVTKSGWNLQNCYDKIRGVCQHNSDPFAWNVTADISSYLDWGNTSSCPDGYKVGVPHSSLEQFSLLSYLENSDIRFPVWIDVNDITIPRCFVSGGPYAMCPYQEALTTKDFIKNIAPSASVALFLIFVIFFERIIMKTPIHSNRKRHWKKKIADYYKDNDYEGVPL